MNRFKRFFFLIIFCLGVQSCNTQGSSTPSPIPATETSTAQPTPSMILHPAELTGQQITIALGDVFAVALPDQRFNWQINFADTVIQMLTPLENVVDNEGWLFRATAPGLTDIRVTASAAPCPSETPCPPPPPITFVFTIEVK